jgi:predicted metal-dependent hydrolase
MKRTCQESPSGQLLRGIREFNRGDWLESHDTVEELWIGETGEVRELYQGIIQIAVALHHWRNGNFRGAVSLLKGGAGYLRHVAGQCQWIDVTSLIVDAECMCAALEELGEVQMKSVPPLLFPA